MTGKKIMTQAGGVIFMLVVLPAAMYLMPMCDGAYDPAFQALNQCPAATAVLGAPIERSAIGVACGSSETQGGGFGHAQWSMPVAGSQASGTFQYAGQASGGQWAIMRAQLEVGNQYISVVPCQPSNFGQPPAPGQIPVAVPGQPMPPPAQPVADENK